MRHYYVSSMIEGINTLIGGLPVGSMLGLYGMAEAGKTTLAFHMIYDRLIENNKNPSNALIFDTEGSEYTYIEWLERLNERHGVDVGLKWLHYNPDTLKISETSDNKEHHCYIYVLDVRTLEHILAFHGRGCSISISKVRNTRSGEIKGGKITLKPENSLWTTLNDSPLGEIVEEKEIGILLYDSITNPLTIFGSQEENLPARANCTSWWLTRVQELAEAKDLVVIGVMHETSNPQREWERPGYEGGKTIEHNFKFVVYISLGKSKRTPKTPQNDTSWHPTTRELRNARHPSKKPFEMYVKLDLTDSGFVDTQ